MISLPKKHIPLAVFVVIFVVIIGIGIGISSYGSKTTPTSTDDTQSPTTTTVGIPYQLKNPENNTYQQGQGTTLSTVPSSPSTQNSLPDAPTVTIPQSPSAISILYPTRNKTLINDPRYHTPVAIILWKSKLAGLKNITLDLQDQSGAIVKNIVTNTADTGTYVWFSDVTISNGSYRLRVHSTTPKGTIAEDLSDEFNIASPDSSQHPQSVWQTYKDIQHNFSLTYPDDFSFASFGPQYPGTTVLKLAPKLNYYIHANDIETVDASEIILSEKPGNADACPTTAEVNIARGYVYGNIDTLQGLYQLFKRIKRSDFGINNQRSDYIYYYTSYNGTCYAFQFKIHRVQIPFSNNALYQAPDKLENDILRMTANVEQMVLSMKFSQQ